MPWAKVKIFSKWTLVSLEKVCSRNCRINTLGCLVDSPIVKLASCVSSGRVNLVGTVVGSGNACLSKTMDHQIQYFEVIATTYVVQIKIYIVVRIGLVASISFHSK
jgi:hypothetical protein